MLRDHDCALSVLDMTESAESAAQDGLGKSLNTLAPHDPWCRHCGRSGEELTQEHIPPRSSGNSDPISRSNEPPLSVPAHPILDKETDWPGGHTVRTLCGDCNHKPSRWGYVASYEKLRDFFVSEALERAELSGGFDPIANREFGAVELPYDLNPRRFLAQCIGMVMASQISPSLVANDVLRSFIGADLRRDASPPSTLGLGEFTASLALCNKNIAFQRSPVAHVGPGGGSYSWTFFFTPFAFTLNEGPMPPLWQAVDISAWADLDHHDRLKPAARKFPDFPCVPGGKAPLFT